MARVSNSGIASIDNRSGPAAGKVVSENITDGRRDRRIIEIAQKGHKSGPPAGRAVSTIQREQKVHEDPL